MKKIDKIKCEKAIDDISDYFAEKDFTLRECIVTLRCLLQGLIETLKQQKESNDE